MLFAAPGEKRRLRNYWLICDVLRNYMKNQRATQTLQLKVAKLSKALESALSRRRGALIDGIRHPGMVGHACQVEMGRAVDSRIGNGLRGPLLSTRKSRLIPL